jgi:hypothetical protein
MVKRKNHVKWKVLTKEQEKEIVKDFDIGIARNEIMRKHEIHEGQLYSVIRNAAAITMVEMN